MAFKTILQLCVSVFVVKTVLSQCIPSQGTQNVCAPAPVLANCGFPMSSQPTPIEISISSDNLIIDGCFDVTGTMPFYGAVVVDGVVPNCGEASAFYECGNGNVGIDFPTSGLVGTGTGSGYNPGLGFVSGGCGCA